MFHFVCLLSEFGVPFDLEAKAPYLALLGDIGVVRESAYRSLLLEAAEKFEKVFVVLGNHEFYGSVYESAICSVEAICAEKPGKLFLLHRRSHVIGHVRVIGATLWTDILPDEMDWAEYLLNDFKCIKMESGDKFSADQLVRFHREEVEFIERELEEARAHRQRAVVLSHHAPLLDIAISKADEMGDRCEMQLRSGNGTDLRSHFRPPLVGWLYGHTHWFQDMDVQGVRVMSNPRGYPNEKIFNLFIFRVFECENSEPSFE